MGQRRTRDSRSVSSRTRSQMGVTVALLTMVLSVMVAAPAYAQVEHFVINPTPIAADGSLAAGASVGVQVAHLIDTTPDNGPVWLSFTPTLNGGTALVNDTFPLTTTPQQFPGPVVPVTFHAGTASTGTDTLIAQNAVTNATVTATDTYTYVSTVDEPEVCTATVTLKKVAFTAIHLDRDAELSEFISGPTSISTNGTIAPGGSFSDTTSVALTKVQSKTLNHVVKTVTVPEGSKVDVDGHIHLQIPVNRGEFTFTFTLDRKLFLQDSECPGGSTHTIHDWAEIPGGHSFGSIRVTLTYELTITEDLPEDE